MGSGRQILIPHAIGCGGIADQLHREIIGRWQCEDFPKREAKKRTLRIHKATVELRPVRRILPGRYRLSKSPFGI